MVTRRRLLIVAGLLTAWALGLSWVWFLRAPRRISAETFARIQSGMTKAEVTTIVGETDDWVSLGAGRHSAYYKEYGGGRGATIEVRFDKDDRVFDKAFEKESVEAWLSRRWRK